LREAWIATTISTGPFLPLRGEDERQKRIEEALARGEVLPPVKLYKIGEVYFVVDGHHRVSAAKKAGAKFIDAEVVELLSDVPLSPKDTEKDILLKAEYASFLRHTKLKELRPEAETHPERDLRLPKAPRAHRCSPLLPGPRGKAGDPL